LRKKRKQRPGKGRGGVLATANLASKGEGPSSAYSVGQWLRVARQEDAVLETVELENIFGGGSPTLGEGSKNSAAHFEGVEKGKDAIQLNWDGSGQGKAKT